MRYVLDLGGLGQLLAALRQRGFRLIGPVVADGAICYGEITSAADLPAGWTDEQDGGTYRLKRRDDGALFGYNVGPQSPKKYLFPASATLWRSHPPGTADTDDEKPFAFIGVRSCELHAIAVQDRVFLGGQHPDPLYAARRDGAFIVAVNCGQAARTCFCVSMSAGPKADAGFDLALTELTGEGGHRFLAETGTPRGEEVIADTPGAQPASPRDATAADQIIERTAAQMGRAMPAVDLRDLLYGNLEHPRWDDVAARCLTCGNCTMACPTCFCFSVEDVTDLAGRAAERNRSWDSCFTLDHSYIHGGPVRTSARSRYRQWMTHKLATWTGQFGTSGCVGCGRCITWCPAGIDITEEVAAIAADT
ncbi:MAG: 4Fe-4S dicluster domain-containing protein [Streptosporangiaceae bacterium]|nr:4Fe-4S dicluster domain-containing protein [Streptosporangiaceae bacterium]MBV9855776.1 4Fe-4S dicluster domain-containing protein [Streptosporangiaceae bacterium]